jgi:predicted PolB exonuclease-like 3'-5' exonuclease
MNRLIADIETSPNIGLFWRAGYKQNISYDNIIEERKIICIAYKWEHANKVEYLTWDKSQCDKKMLAAFIEVMEEADEIVFHNGDRFDIPWIRTRALLHGLPAWSEPKQVDTLKWAKRRFYFQSNRLDYLGEILTGSGKIKTEYGIWKDILLKKCPVAMAKMVKYCKMDVKKLQEVYEVLARYMPAETHESVLGGEEKWMSPFCEGSKNIMSKGKRITARGTVTYRMTCNVTGRHYVISTAAKRDYDKWRADHPRHGPDVAAYAVRKLKKATRKKAVNKP